MKSAAVFWAATWRDPSENEPRVASGKSQGGTEALSATDLILDNNQVHELKLFPISAEPWDDYSPANTSVAACEGPVVRRPK